MLKFTLFLSLLVLGSVAKPDESKTNQVLKAWMQMQNTGTDQAIRHFIDQYYSPKLLQKMKNYEAHVKFYKQIIDEFGPVQEFIYQTDEEGVYKLKVQLLKEGRTTIPEPSAEEILVVNIDLDPENPDYLVKGLGLGALVCYIKR